MLCLSLLLSEQIYARVLTLRLTCVRVHVRAGTWVLIFFRLSLQRMEYKKQKYPNWIASKTMVGRADLTGDEKWILTVLIAAIVAIKKNGNRAINPTLTGVSNTIGRSLEDLTDEFEDLKDRGYITYTRKGEITAIYIEKLESDGVIDPGSIPCV